MRGSQLQASIAKSEHTIIAAQLPKQYMSIHLSVTSLARMFQQDDQFCTEAKQARLVYAIQKIEASHLPELAEHLSNLQVSTRAEKGRRLIGSLT